jgi:hypothetical protein
MGIKSVDESWLLESLMAFGNEQLYSLRNLIKVIEFCDYWGKGSVDLGGGFQCNYKDIFIYFVWQVKSVHAYFPEDSEPSEKKTTFDHLIKFLERCVEEEAIVYRRDKRKIVWYILDETKYRECCNNSGFSEADFKYYPSREVTERLKKMKAAHMKHKTW